VLEIFNRVFEVRNMADIEQNLLMFLTGQPNFVFKPADNDSSTKLTVCIRNYSIANASWTPVPFFNKDLDA